MLQTAYQKGASCEEAIFATQEMIVKLLKENGSALLCLYDLEKAFDTIETLVLLQSLYEAGVNGKTWRIVKEWYSERSESV